jgi:hypothetical protein
VICLLIAGYHSHIKVLTHNHSGSPKRLHRCLLEYNFRLACNQGVKFGILNPEFSGFYDFQLLEEINSLTSFLGLLPKFMDVPSIFSYKDTGERFGLRANVMEEMEESKELIPFFASDNSSACKTMFMNYSDLLDREPTMPIRTSDEKAKFASEWMRYRVRGDKIDFSQMATDWNVDFYLMKSGQKQRTNIRPKNIRDLQRYYKTSHESENTYQTMAPHIEATAHLRQDHRRSGIFEMPFNAEADIPGPSGVPYQIEECTPMNEISTVIQPKNKQKCKECGHDWMSPTYKTDHKTSNDGPKRRVRICSVSFASKRHPDSKLGERCDIKIGAEGKRCTNLESHWHTNCNDVCCRG